MLDFIIELILDLLFEGSFEIKKNKKISKWIRYPFALIVIIFVCIFVFAIFYLGILIFSENALIGSLIIGIGVFISIKLISKFRKIYLKID